MRDASAAARKLRRERRQRDCRHTGNLHQRHQWNCDEVDHHARECDA
jgi:hypothetical protein